MNKSSGVERRMSTVGSCAHASQTLHDGAHTHAHMFAGSGEQEVNEALDNAGPGWANFSQDLSTCRAALAALQLLQEEQFLQQNVLDCAQAGSATISLYLLSPSLSDLFAQMYFACCRRAVSIAAKAGSAPTRL